MPYLRISARRGAMMADDLSAIRNLGPATRADLARLGVSTRHELALQDPDELYVRISRMDGRAHDPCVWDTFAAIIHIAQGGEAKTWWAFTPIRKARQLSGDFPKP